MPYRDIPLWHSLNYHIPTYSLLHFLDYHDEECCEWGTVLQAANEAVLFSGGKKSKQKYNLNCHLKLRQKILSSSKNEHVDPMKHLIKAVLNNFPYSSLSGFHTLCIYGWRKPLSMCLQKNPQRSWKRERLQFANDTVIRLGIVLGLFYCCFLTLCSQHFWIGSLEYVFSVTLLGLLSKKWNWAMNFAES